MAKTKCQYIKKYIAWDPFLQTSGKQWQLYIAHKRKVRQCPSSNSKIYWRLSTVYQVKNNSTSWKNISLLYRIVNHSVHGKHIRKVKYKAVVTDTRSRECYNLSVLGPAVDLLITCCCCSFWYNNQHRVFLWSLIYSWIYLPSFPGLIWSLITSILLQLLSLIGRSFAYVSSHLFIHIIIGFNDKFHIETTSVTFWQNM